MDDIVERLREGATVLDEPFHRNALELVMLEAADEIERLRTELERERTRLAACGVVATADTPESARQVRQMHEDYRSASCDDVARRVDECMRLRAELADAIKAIDRLHDERRELMTECKELTDVLLRNGFRRCDIPACNCGSWHHVGGFAERFREIDEVTGAEYRNGETLLSRIKRLMAECEALRKDAEKLRYISAHSWVEYTSAGFVIHLGLGYRQHNPSLFLSLIDRAMASSAEGQEVKP